MVSLSDVQDGSQILLTFTRNEPLLDVAYSFGGPPLVVTR